MQDIRRQIIALGGGGFAVNPDNLALDRYIVAQARVSDPDVVFIPTASGDADPYIVRFYTAYLGLPCRPSHVSFFRRTPDLRSYLLAQDVIYVGGGNTKSMLAVWRDWGVPELLREACAAGIVLAGISAGAICWFVQGITDSFADQLKVLDCLGFLPGSCCPHYRDEAERRPAYHRLLRDREIAPGWAIDDGAALHFVNGELHRVVSARQGSTAYQVRTADGVVQEEPIAAEHLTP
jgi:dipeptidase E